MGECHKYYIAPFLVHCNKIIAMHNNVINLASPANAGAKPHSIPAPMVPSVLAGLPGQLGRLFAQFRGLIGQRRDLAFHVIGV